MATTPPPDPVQQSRSPSPAHAPPIPTAPGPRATALQKLFSDAITHVLKTCNYTNFSACFPTPARENSGTLKLLHEDFVQRLDENWRRHFDDTLDVRHVVPSLNELDGLIEDARRRKRGGGEMGVPLHTLPAQKLYLSHLAPSLQQHSQTLKERQDAVQEENVELLAKVMQQRKEIEGLVKGLEIVVADLDASVHTLQTAEVGDEEGRRLLRGVDEEVR